jgi:hypothetical protein
MKGDRKRSPVKTDYLEALGYLAYCFASCEWQVAWCCERIKPGSLREITGGEMTAGQIAHFFKDIARNMPRSSEREQLKELAQTFIALAEKRNDILHAKPCTGPSGEARLSSDKVLEIADLEDAADSLAECAGKLNALFYGYLQTKYMPTP